MYAKATRALPLQSVTVRDAFFAPIQLKIIDKMLPYQERVLHDTQPGAPKSHAIENFRIAAGESDGAFEGMVFQDSDVAKWLEAVAYALVLRPDPALEARADALIDLIGRAQQPDGYLNTFFTAKEPEHRWQNLQECHELYCAGHMLEAGIAYFEATGKDKLLSIMVRMAEHIADRFGPGGLRGIPGHEEIELALLRLYAVTGNEAPLRLAAYFIDERGTAPEFFAEECKGRDWGHFGGHKNEWDPTYTQNHLPVREQKDAEGHAVRAVYLYTAMADLASYTGDASLRAACEALWDSITRRRMYITGGIGSTAEGERFTIDYDLPNDSIYAETCASIGLMFFARRMLELDPNGRYADEMERALYNGVISGMQLDAEHFFYCNPLEAVPGVSGKLSGFRHALAERPAWYGCACCPPNLSRLLTSLGQYAWGEGDGAIYSHLYLGGDAAFDIAGGVRVSLEAQYPWHGEMTYTVTPAQAGAAFALHIRIPAWCRQAALAINGEAVDLAACTANGYARLSRAWQAGDTVRLTLDMPVRRMWAGAAVRSDAGCCALMRGPLVYAFEGIDNGEPLHALRIPRDAVIEALPYDPALLGGIVPLRVEGLRAHTSDDLYSDEPPREEPATLRAIPYYAWSNRAPGGMQVWMRE